jgi:hypothetical protein
MVKGSLRMVPLYHEWFQKGLKPYRWYIEGVKRKLGLTSLFMESLEYARRSKPGGGPP